MINFEKHRLAAREGILHETDKNLNFALHYHDEYEFLYCYDGVINVTVVDRIYRLRQGKCVLIAPQQPHAYDTPDYSKTYLCVFPKELVGDFYEEYKNKEAMYPVFTMPAAEMHCKRLQTITDKYALKGVLYNIVSAYCEHTAFNTIDEKKYATLHSIIGYVEKNAAGDIDMREMAVALGYSYNYVSALFNTAFNTNFMDVVNSYRVNMAENLLVDSDLPIAEIAQKVGYDSLRSFNRNFKKYSGKTPSEAKELAAKGEIAKF